MHVLPSGSELGRVMKSLAGLRPWVLGGARASKQLALQPSLGLSGRHLPERSLYICLAAAAGEVHERPRGMAPLKDGVEGAPQQV